MTLSTKSPISLHPAARGESDAPAVPAAAPAQVELTSEDAIVAAILARGGATAGQIASGLLQVSALELHGLGLLLALERWRSGDLATQLLLPAPVAVLRALLKQTARQTSDRWPRRAVEQLVLVWNSRSTSPVEGAPARGQKTTPSLSQAATGSRARLDSKTPGSLPSDDREMQG